jgi:hypothetical protein
VQVVGGAIEPVVGMAKMYPSIGLVAFLLLAGCATITKGTTQQVSLETPGYAGAECTLRSEAIGTRTVITPTVLELPKSRDNIAVQCRAGCMVGTGVIQSNLEGMTAGNILLGGVIGIGVDAATGAMNKYSNNNQVVLSPGPGFPKKD